MSLMSLTNNVTEAHKKADLSALPQQFKNKEAKTQNQNPTAQQSHDKRQKDAGNSWGATSRCVVLVTFGNN